MVFVRLWIPTASMLLVSLISYIDRNTLALLAPTIMQETALTGEQYGYIISAFSVAYMIGNPVWGRILDRFGVRAGMLVAVSFWTLASVSHAFANGFRSFAAARALLGFGEGATFPGGLRTVVQTLPPQKRSRGIAVAYSGGSLGAIVTPLLITPIAGLWGWRGAFLFTGIVGAAWVLLWSVVSRRETIRNRPQVSRGSAPGPKLGDPKIWAFVCAYAFGGIPLAFVIYGASIYLSQVLGKSQVEIGTVLWIPPLGWELGYFFWGWISDRSLKANISRLGAFRAMLGTAALFSLPLMATPWLISFWAVMLALFFAMFVAAGFVILSIALCDGGIPRGAFGPLSRAWGRIVVRHSGFDDACFRQTFRLTPLGPGVRARSNIPCRRLRRLATADRPATAAARGKNYSTLLKTLDICVAAGLH
jgi:ACS family hexuronate transporter-like MFS transporter